MANNMKNDSPRTQFISNGGNLNNFGTINHVTIAASVPSQQPVSEVTARMAEMLVTGKPKETLNDSIQFICELPPANVKTETAESKVKTEETSTSKDEKVLVPKIAKEEMVLAPKVMKDEEFIPPPMNLNQDDLPVHIKRKGGKLAETNENYLPPGDVQLTSSHFTFPRAIYFTHKGQDLEMLGVSPFFASYKGGNPMYSWVIRLRNNSIHFLLFNFERSQRSYWFHEGCDVMEPNSIGQIVLQSNRANTGGHPCFKLFAISTDRNFKAKHGQVAEMTIDLTF